MYTDLAGRLFSNASIYLLLRVLNNQEAVSRPFNLLSYDCSVSSQSH